MYLSGVNCIYDDGTVISMDQGSCEPVTSEGANLVDTDNEAQSVTVTTPYPLPGWLPAAVTGLILLATFGGFKHVRGR